MCHRSLLFDIKRYAIHDGPGIRTTIFMKGCPLRCVWCHNPESWLPGTQRLYKASKCIGCASCVEACPKRALKLTPDGIRPTGEECVLCGRCAEACPAKAMEICGREWRVEELMAEVEKERDVMQRSGGGVTISGGEPLMQPEYTLSLLEEMGRRDFHRAVDTSLYAPSGTVRAAAQECELFLVDLKVMDPGVHRRYTGVGNALILENLRMLSSLKKPYIIRIPLIAEVNVSEANMAATASFLRSLDSLPEEVDLLPYHDIGRGKHERLGTVYNPEALSLSTPSKEEQERCVSQLTASGLTVRIGG